MNTAGWCHAITECQDGQDSCYRASDGTVASASCTGEMVDPQPNDMVASLDTVSRTPCYSNLCNAAAGSSAPVVATLLVFFATAFLMG